MSCSTMTLGAGQTLFGAIIETNHALQPVPRDGVANAPPPVNRNVYSGHGTELSG